MCFFPCIFLVYGLLEFLKNVLFCVLPSYQMVLENMSFQAQNMIFRKGVQHSKEQKATTISHWIVCVVDSEIVQSTTGTLLGKFVRTKKVEMDRAPQLAIWEANIRENMDKLVTLCFVGGFLVSSKNHF